MGRRRRKKVAKIVRRQLPKVFVCPRCGGHSIKITIKESEGMAMVQCSLCSLKQDIPAPSTNQPVDIYCKFTDLFYTGKITA